MNFDSAYRTARAYFGEAPDRLLLRHLALLRKESRILDLGMGQGRNALWLARRGFAVDGIEPSAVARKHVDEAALKEGLALGIHAKSFQSFEAAEGSYGAILAFGLIPILARADLTELQNRISRWLCIDGLLLVTAFTTEDPSYGRFSRRESAADEKGFVDERGSHRTFLKPGGILDLFAAYEVLHHEEYLGEAHRHGEGPVHRHAWTEAVFRRATAS